MPRPGEIVHAVETWEAPAGGGAVAAVQLARHADECLFLTALGDDELGRRAERELGELGVRVRAAWRDAEELHLSFGLALEALLIRLRRELAGAQVLTR